MNEIAKALMLGMTLLSLPSCAPRTLDYTINDEGGASTYDHAHALVRWNRAMAFRQADVSLRLSQHPRFCEVSSGAHTIVYATQGYVLPLTVNVMQYWTAVLCLPDQLHSGEVVELSWADCDSLNPLQVGQVAVRARQGLTCQRTPVAGKPAGRVTVLSHADGSLNLRLELTIIPHPYDKKVIERGHLSREFKLALKPVTRNVRLLASPKGATEEVDTPRLGSVLE